MVVDGPVLAALGVLDEHRDSDRSTGTRSEDLAALFARLLALRALVASQVEHVDRAELVHQRLPEPVHRLPVEPSAVGDEAHHAAVADSVGCPAEGPYVGVVERVLVGGGPARGVGGSDLAVERRIAHVLVVVVGVLLAGGVRRVADDDVDRRLHLPEDALGVVDEGVEVDGVPLLVHLEGVGEHRALERHVLAGHARVVGVLDVDGGDVVGQKHDLVAVHLVGVLVGEPVVGDEPRILQQVHDERAGAREGVQYVHALVGQGLAELLLEQPVGGVQDVVHNLVGRVDDAHLLVGGLERLAEELLVELFDDLLAAAVGAHRSRTQAHARVELGQLAPLGLGLDAVFAQRVDHALHGDGHGVRARELGAREQRLEHGERDHVLGKHLDGLALGDAVVERVSQAL